MKEIVKEGTKMLVKSSMSDKELLADINESHNKFSNKS